MKRHKISVKTRLEEEPKKIPFVVALANKILSMIGFVNLIDQSVDWDPNQWIVSPGNLAKAVVLSTFFDMRAPLCNIWKRFEGLDTELLFGPGVEHHHLNDDAIGRALDRISEAKPEKLYGTLCLTAYTIYKIAFKRLHSDTTTVSFYGEYKPSEEDVTLKVVKGHNKDHRPECKQVVVGKIVTEHGIPIASVVMDGNTSDVDWNKQAIELARDIFQDQLEQGIYIADCKLMTSGLYRTMTEPQKRIRFISRCPASFYNKLESRTIERAYQDNQWQDCGKLGSGKKACSYKVQEFKDSVYASGVRLLVVQTSAGHDRFINKKKKKYEELQGAIEEINKKVFVCEADAKQEYERFVKSHKKSLYSYDAEYSVNRIEKRRPGRPGKDPQTSKIEEKWKLRIFITGEDAVAMARFQHTEECFVLITNVNDKDLSSIDILRYYKDQYVVEVNFDHYKRPCLASVIYLKDPDRVNALMMLLSVSLLVRGLIQYKMRKGFEENTEPLPKVGWNGAELQPNLTMKFMEYALQNQYFIRDDDYTYSYRFTSPTTALRIQTLFGLMGVSVEELLE